MSELGTHKGHEVDVHFENYSRENVNRYTEQMNDIRSKCPVAWTDGHWSPKDTGFWLLTKYKDCRDVAMNWQLFTTAQGANPMQQDLDIFRMVPLEVDPPLHTKVRMLLAKFFVPAALEPFDDRIRRIINELLDDCVAGSPTDFVKTFSIALPSRVFFELFLGEDPKEIGWIMELTQILIDDPSSATELAPKLLEWCADVLEARRQVGRKDDIIGIVAHAGNEPDFQLSDRERVEILNLLVLAGMETTANGVSAVVHTLATHPEIRARLAQAEEDRLNKAVDEFLRFASPVTSAGRTVTGDTEVFGRRMCKGERVTVSWTAANRDPDAFPDPDVLNLDRNASQHLAFGHGHHKCIGMHLAKREMRLAIEELCKLSTLELVPGAEITYRTGPQQGIVSLPIVCAR
jgi:cytochrome P450